MTALTVIDSFINFKRIAVVGVSRKNKFGNVIYKEMASKGYAVTPVNPNLETFENATCYPTLEAIEHPVEGAVICVKKDKVLDVLNRAENANIRYVWIQQGAGSDEAKAFCDAHQLNAVFGQCILMHAKPVKGLHAIHRFFWRLYMGLSS